MAEWYGKDIKTSAKECAGYFKSKQQHLWINNIVQHYQLKKVGKIACLQNLRQINAGCETSKAFQKLNKGVFVRLGKKV